MNHTNTNSNSFHNFCCSQETLSCFCFLIDQTIVFLQFERWTDSLFWIQNRGSQLERVDRYYSAAKRGRSVNFVERCMAWPYYFLMNRRNFCGEIISLYTILWWANFCTLIGLWCEHHTQTKHLIIHDDFKKLTGVCSICEFQNVVNFKC